MDADKESKVATNLRINHTNIPMSEKQELVYEELSFKIVGVLFEVDNQLGNGFQERYYQKAIAKEFRNREIQFKEQVHVPLMYKEEKLGDYYLDFVIEDKIAIEIKKDKRFSQRNITQLHAYLKASGLKLGILANFTSDGVKFKRILNIR